MRATSKTHFNNESIILKFTKPCNNFIKQQCQGTGLRRANRPLSAKSEFGPMVFHMVDFCRMSVSYNVYIITEVHIVFTLLKKFLI